MAGMRKDIERLLQTLTDSGCTVRLMGNGHWRVSRPGYRSITVTKSPSDHRALDNAKSEARRHLGVAV